MKKFFLMALSIICLASCQKDMYEPDFQRSDLPKIIPATGGQYSVKVDYVRVPTRSKAVYLEWEFRTIIDGKVEFVTNFPEEEYDIYIPDDRFTVVIPENRSGYTRSVTVEASTKYHGNDGEGDYDWWSDWNPVCACVQLSY